jgi:hypothetical protein
VIGCMMVRFQVFELEKLFALCIENKRKTDCTGLIVILKDLLSC